MWGIYHIFSRNIPPNTKTNLEDTNMTQEYINGYIAALNNLLYVYRQDLCELRKGYYKGTFNTKTYVYDRIPNSNYKLFRLKVLQHIKSVRIIKNNYKKFIKNINKLTNNIRY